MNWNTLGGTLFLTAILLLLALATKRMNKKAWMLVSFALAFAAAVVAAAIPNFGEASTNLVSNISDAFVQFGEELLGRQPGAFGIAADAVVLVVIFGLFAALAIKSDRIQDKSVVFWLGLMMGFLVASIPGWGPDVRDWIQQSVDVAWEGILGLLRGIRGAV